MSQLAPDAQSTTKHAKDPRCDMSSGDENKGERTRTWGKGSQAGRWVNNDVKRVVNFGGLKVITAFVTGRSHLCIIIIICTGYPPSGATTAGFYQVSSSVYYLSTC